MFYVPVSSYIRLYYSDNVNAVFPNTYVELSAGSLNPGNWYGTDVTPNDQRRYVLTAQCGPPPILTAGVGRFLPGE
jgi:hypothetical protein